MYYHDNCITNQDLEGYMQDRRSCFLYNNRPYVVVKNKAAVVSIDDNRVAVMNLMTHEIEFLMKSTIVSRADLKVERTA